MLAYRGEADRAFEWLGKTAQYRDPVLGEISAEPAFTNIHSDPHGLPLLESIGCAPSLLDVIEFEVMPP